MVAPTTFEQPDLEKVSILGVESIHVGFHLIPYIIHTVLHQLPSSTYVLLTDTNLAKLFLPAVEEEFHAQASTVERKTRLLSFQVRPGEEAKSRKQKELIEDFMLENKCTRDTVILALGGGVVGDLSGFVAATFMRGVRFVQIPTTLLAMVDSSVGGKTAVDTRHGKNMIGAFWQPSFIFVDLAFLETLNMREFSNGMAEVIKTAAIWKEDDFEKLESRANEISSPVQSGSSSKSHLGRTLATRTEPQEMLLSVVTGSIYVKAHVVTIDERETGLRNLVNFGHTIGHAIEAILFPKLLHGECVAIGMILEAEVARQLGILSQVAVGRLTRCLKAYGLPVSLNDPRVTSLPAAKMLSTDRLMDFMRIDKKNVGDTKKIVLLDRIGKTWELKASAVKDDTIRRVLCEAIRVYGGIPKGPAANKQGKGIVMSTPGSKSISNRALVLAALGTGVCRMRNLLHSDDTAVMMSALKDLKGADFSWEDGGDTLVVTGGGGALSPPLDDKHIYLQNAGTAARFLATVCALVSPSAASDHTIITGNSRMKQRPIGPLVDALRSNGKTIEYLESDGCLPLKVSAGGMRGGHIQLAASVSSQYVSSILLCAPYASEPITLELTGGQVISQPYIDMTIAMMNEFGIRVERQRDPVTNAMLDIYTIAKGSYTNPPIYNVESDASSATYPLAIAAITGTTCTISNIGSSSLQGDAGFAVNVLQRMGCDVRQTATETTVTGPPIGQLRALGNVDMETMTDAFLTASVLAAVATQPHSDSTVEGKTTTRIYGIANQRVKECNRIKAMRDQLAKFGVATDEFDDGIIIHGLDYTKLKSDVHVHCYDDHRVGMAFSVLACVVSETVITEKRCVEKTWPNFWDDLSRVIGIDVVGEDLGDSSDHASTSAAIDSTVAAKDFAPDATIFLIGMRGAGKTYVGSLAAELLGRPFLDADNYFVEQEKALISDFVAKHGWPGFREKEVVHLKQLMETKSHGWVISLGGGVVESPEARQILKAYSRIRGPVIHVSREISEIHQYLQQIGDGQSARPGWGESIKDVFQRRQPWLHDCSTYDYINYTGLMGSQLQGLVNGDAPTASSGSGTRLEARRFFRFITLADSNRPHLDKPQASSFLSLTLPDITPILGDMEELTIGVDAIELRADLLSPSGRSPTQPAIPPLHYVGFQLGALRQHTSLPIVFSVRTAAQGGFFPDDAVEQYVELVQFGMRIGCEYVDVEINTMQEKLASLVAARGLSHVIASWHDWTGAVKWHGPEMLEKYHKCLQYGDIVKLVGTAKTYDDNTALAAFVSQVQCPKPMIAINMGTAGQLSRALNTFFTPVTHPLLPISAAPGQISFEEIQQALYLIGRLPQRKFYLFGTPISQSLSPTLHNTGFRMLGLPHQYGLHETTEVDVSIKEIIGNPSFGGASVTIPHKLAIMPFLDTISEHAKQIGAVNTVIPLYLPNGKRVLHGENTDWQAMRVLVTARMPQGQTIDAETTGLVIGAGGTSRAAIYTMHALGIKTIYLYNRTVANAQKLVEAFPADYNIVVVPRLGEFPGKAPTVIISTVPGGGCTLDETGEGVYLPSSIFANVTGGVAIDMAYRPNITPLLSLATQQEAWSVVTGVEILCEQAFFQFEAWTGRRAPKGSMRKAAMDRYNA